MKSIAENCPFLAGLDVTGCSHISDDSLTAISSLEHLTWLTFSETKVTYIYHGLLYRGMFITKNFRFEENTFDRRKKYLVLIYFLSV